MNKDTSLETLINEVVLLARRQARGTPARVGLSKDTESLLLSIGLVQEPQDAPDMAAAPAENHTGESAASTASSKMGENEVKCSVVRSESIGEDSLERIAEEVAVCAKCPLGSQRNKPVPGEGNLHASLVFVGEAPGAEEDKSGRPFVGRAGQLLTDIIVKGMHLQREEVYICNVLKCRPPNNRTPNPEEVMQCEPYLLRQLDAIQPKVICALGAVAAQTLLKTDAPIKQLRGVWHNYHDIPFRVTYHPAYLLRQPSEKKKTWEDIQEVMRVLRGEVVPEI